MVLTLVTGVLVAALMEGWAAWLHGKLWHGPLWPAHRSHHPPPPAPGQRPPSGWEFNDIFGLCHAMVAAPLIMWGLTPPFDLPQQLALGVGMGMTAFGLAYGVVHDGLVHGRLPVGFLRRSAFLRRVAAAHRVHHKLGGPPFGLFCGPWALRRHAARRKQRAAARLVQSGPGR
jgi:beta-carotene 3-hydroxylase